MWNNPSNFRQPTNAYKQHHAHNTDTPTAEVQAISLLSVLPKDAANLSDYTTSVMDKRIWCTEGMTMTVENGGYYLKPAFCKLKQIKQETSE
jgi:hypothetical protein